MAFAALLLAAFPVFADEPNGKAGTKLSDLFNQAGTFGQFQGNDAAELSAEFKPTKVKNGDTVTLSVILDLPEGYHTYPQKSTVGMPTRIRIKKTAGLRPLGEGFIAATKPQTAVDAVLKTSYGYFDTSVTWTRQFEVVDAENLAKVAVEGTVRFQLCTKAICKPPKTESFTATAIVNGAESTKPADNLTNTESVAVSPKSARGKIHPFSHEVTPKWLGKPHPLKLKFALKPQDAKPGDVVTVSITAMLDKGWHAFALTHSKGGTGLPVTIRVSSVNGLTPVGKGWRPNKAPEIKIDDTSKDGAKLLEHHGVVTWSRKFQVAANAKPGEIGIAGKIRYQICETKKCLFPKTVKFSLGNLTTSMPAPKGSDDIDKTPFPGGVKSEVPSGTGWKPESILLTSCVIFSLGLALLGVFGIPFPKPEHRMVPIREFAGFVLLGLDILFVWWVLDQEILDHKYVTPLLVMMLGITLGLWMIGNLYSPKSQTKQKMIVGTTAAVLSIGICWFGYWLTQESQYRLPWKTFTNETLDEALAEKRTVLVDFTADWCLICKQNEIVALNRKQTLAFIEQHDVVTLLADYTDESPVIRKWLEKFETDGVPLTVIFPANRPDQPIVLRGGYLQSTLLEKLEQAVSESSTQGDETKQGTLGWFLLAAFLGGLILNVMPCVLPVIAIKVMSFVQQAGESRGRILALNAVYSVGVVAVFLVLATLAVGISAGGDTLGWGGLFQKAEFNLTMACVMFAMGLALLGVFEITIPGVIGSAAGGAHREGLGGAFLTGVFATLLATPCTGPFMGPALAWSVKQPPATTFLIWGMMGLGMAFPYLVFGFFPQAIKLLPKPGNWMVRFKQFAGFALMGTVIFFASFLSTKFVIPLLLMMYGIAVGLWMIGNLYSPISPVKQKTAVRIAAAVLSIGMCWFGYSIT